MIDYISDYITKVENRMKGKEEILSNLDYMNWLQDFTAQHYSFSDVSLLDFPLEITDEDKKQIEKLELLYEIIDEYARENYIFPNEGEFDYYFHFKYKNIGYIIGVTVGQGVSCFCKREEINPKILYIDFNDIVNGLKDDKAKMITAKLDDITVSIINLYRQGIPAEAILDTLDKSSEYIKNEKVKKLNR